MRLNVRLPNPLKTLLQPLPEQLAQTEPVMAAVSKEAAELPAEEEAEEVKTKPVIEEAVIGKPVNFEQKANPVKWKSASLKISLVPKPPNLKAARPTRRKEGIG